ncbi:replication protein A 70 kDa DNA-binding subunit B [Tanacetum coccineum]
MDQNITQLCDIDPMLDDLKIVARCISVWKPHPAGNPKDGNRVQATCKNEHMNKFQLLLDEGSCYRIDVIGTVVSISVSIPYNNSGEDKIRRNLILEDVEGRKMDCRFFDGWATKFDNLYLNREKIGQVVMILQLEKVTYFNAFGHVTPRLGRNMRRNIMDIITTQWCQQ